MKKKIYYKKIKDTLLRIFSVEKRCLRKDKITFLFIISYNDHTSESILVVKNSKKYLKLLPYVIINRIDDPASYSAKCKMCDMDVDGKYVFCSRCGSKI